MIAITLVMIMTPALMLVGTRHRGSVVAVAWQWSSLREAEGCGAWEIRITTTADEILDRRAAAFDCCNNWVAVEELEWQEVSTI